jgi:hypothetical protein
MTDSLVVISKGYKAEVFMQAHRAISMVREFFDGDHEKALLWMDIPNPLLGNVAPGDMIRMGRGKKLLKFIKETIEENVPPDLRMKHDERSAKEIIRADKLKKLRCAYCPPNKGENKKRKSKHGPKKPRRRGK